MFVRYPWHHTVAVSSLLVVLGASCGGDDGAGSGNDGDSDPVDDADDVGDADDGADDADDSADGADGSDGGAQDPESAFVLGTRVWDDTTTTSYFHVTSSLAEGTEVDSTRALEVPGAAKLYAAYDLGWFAFGEGESPTISRYTLDAQGALKKDASISLQGHGVQGLWDTIYFVSPTKAYYPDRDGTQLIVWNPTTMEITGQIELSETAREGYLALYGYSAIERGDKLLISVGWFDWNETDSVLPATGLLVVDTVSDEVVRFDVDERCGGVTTPVTTATGDTVLMSSALAAAAHRLERLSTAPCALRVRADSDAIDPDYLVQLGTLTGGALSGEPVAGSGNTVFMRVFDEELASVDEPMLTWELTGQAAWRWVRWDVAEDSVEPVASLAPSTSDVVWFRVDDKVYGTETTADYTETTLIELTAEGGPKRGLTAPGFLHGVVRVR
jgi:hypothetical protein